MQWLIYQNFQRNLKSTIAAHFMNEMKGLHHYLLIALKVYLPNYVPASLGRFKP